MTDIGADFRRDGYVVVRGIVPRDDCTRLAARAREIQESTDGPLPQAVQRQYGRHKAVRMVKLNQLTELVPEFEELAHRSEIVDRVEDAKARLVDGKDVRGRPRESHLARTG